MNLEVVSAELREAKPYFKAISPGPSNLLLGRAGSALKVVGHALTGVKSYRRWRAGAEVSDIAVDVASDKVARRITSRAMKPVAKQVTKAHLHVQGIEHRDIKRKNGMGGRSWINKPGRYDMVMIFHDANRAGPHIDVHIGRFSVIYRVKPHTYEQLRYNREGYLTEASRKLLIDHVRSEIDNGSRVPQNLDHSKANARSQWVGGSRDGTNYGDGVTRQIIHESKVDIYKTGRGHPIELYAPVLNPHRGMYIYKIYGGTEKRAPILIWGNRSNQPPALDDRLHLKMLDPTVLDAANIPASKLDWSTTTAKYDGSSCYIVITPKGTTVWSPRQAKSTGEQIEYTHKLNGIASITSPETVVGMGEVLFKDGDAYIPCASGSGVLNSNSVLPSHLIPEVRLYRIDRVGRLRTGDQDFWTNRKLQEDVAALSPQLLRVVELMTPEEARLRGFEGVVAVPHNSSVKDGFKIKWWQDAADWRIDRVAFEPGSKGGVAGVVWCTSLESGKRFKLGPGQVGNRQLTEEMMLHPDQYVGAVLKVNSRHGHEGRAAKVLGFHDDKGLSAR